MEHKRFNIKGMYCKDCASKIENALNSKHGIWAFVSIDNNLASIAYDERYQETDILKIIKNEGFDALLNIDDYQRLEVRFI